MRPNVAVLALVVLVLVASSGCVVGDGDSDDEAGLIEASAGQVWPNATSRTNSDAWLRDHHAQISELRPKVLVLIANNRNSIDFVQRKANAVIEAMRTASRYHGYKSSTAAPMLNYEIVKYADMRDNSGKDWPADWPVVADASGKLRFNYEGLFTAAFAVHYGYRERSDETAHYLTLCELFERGIINELWVSAPRHDNNPLGVYETRARAQQYDATGKPIAGSFVADFDPGTSGKCKVTVRLSELATDNDTPDANGNRDRGIGCSVHSIGHNAEFMRDAIPEYRKSSARFFHFDLDTRYRSFMKDQYHGCDYGASNCFSYPNRDTLARPSVNGDPPLRLEKWSDGCGNVHFPPNARSQYDYGATSDVLSTCETYGVRSPNLELKTVFGGGTAEKKVAEYEAKYGDCGGGWQIYMWQSFPGYGNRAIGDDGKPMKSWIPFLFY